MTGIPWTTIRDELKKNGVTLRPNKSVSTKDIFQQKFKSSTPPPYGFTYIGGQLEKDAREYSALLVIHQQWQLGKTASAIFRYLNKQGFKTRMQKEWSRNAVLNILQRFEDKTITINKEKK